MRRSRSRSVHRNIAGLLTASMLALASCEQYTTAPAFTPLANLTPTQHPQTTLLPPNAQMADTIILSMEENGYSHLFAYSPSTLSLTRLTWGAWDDITPAISPDGKTIAFASDRSGYWDLYKMEVSSAATTRLTDTPAFDSSPTWSPDMAWIAFETYAQGHLDIAILSVTDPSQDPTFLTDDVFADHAPTWAPNGRQIAFVSNRTGDADIWLADLNKTQDRFTDLSNTPQAAEDHPAWSRDGAHLAWAAAVPSPGFAGIYVWDATEPQRDAIYAGSGNWPAWNPDGTEIASVVEAPNQELLTAYTLQGKPLLLPSALSGHVRGLLWARADFTSPLPEAFRQASAETPEALSAAPVTPIPGVPSKRWYVVPLQDVQPESAQLHALVAQSFTDLRGRLIREAGWDPMASLENAFVPLTTSLDPGLAEDWLYTGRAFAINSLMVNAGWMSIVREDIGAQTYWRLYLRTQNQDGSQGAPLEDPPWDLNARYQLDPQAYEGGGAFGPVPPGYWVDLTSLASAYGWERLPALSDWRSYYPGARFSEFAMPDGLDWYSAMLQLYPEEALITATAVLPPTSTPSRTPSPTSTPPPTSTPRSTGTPSLTPTPSRTPTPRPPTNSPVPSSTPLTVIPSFPSPTP